MTTQTITPTFEPYPHQVHALRARASGARWIECIWHRRGGKDITAYNGLWASACKRVGNYVHVFPEAAQGRKVWWDGMDNNGKRLIDYMPKELMAGKPNETEMRIEMTNGSAYQVVGADHLGWIGGNMVGAIMSEYQRQDPMAWQLMTPIMLVNGGWAWFAHTPLGHNHAYTLYQNTKNDPAWFVDLRTIHDTKKWDGTPIVTDEMIEWERKQGKSEALIEQEYYCFTGDTQVITESGSRAISTLEVGDVVLTHASRWRPIKRVYKRPYSGPMIHIRSYGHCDEIKCTPEHPIRVLNPSDQTYAWVPAKEIQKGQFITFPRIKPGLPLIAPALAALMGWYVAEGSVSKNLIQFSLGGDEQEFAEEITSLAGALGFEATTRPCETGLTVVINSTTLLDALVSMCGSGAANKHLPMSLITGNEAVIWDALMRGDGCKVETEYESFYSYTTVSESLAYQVQLLSHSLGYRAGVTRRPGGPSVILGRNVTALPSFSVQIRMTGEPTKIKPAKHSIGARVMEVSEEVFEGTVYNLGVKDDESYTANGRVVHNCSFEGNLEGAVYGELLKAARRDHRVTIFEIDRRLPVMTAWDLGMGDATAIGFFQRMGNEHRLIDYYENRGKGLDHYADILRERKRERGYQYEYVDGNIVCEGPHDIKVRELGTGKSRLEQARKFGLHFRVGKKLDLSDGISAVRKIMPTLWIHEKNCERLIEALTAYRYEWDEVKQCFGDKPEHDWTSHGMDMLRYYAVASRDDVSSAPPPPVAVSAFDPWADQAEYEFNPYAVN